MNYTISCVAPCKENVFSRLAFHHFTDVTAVFFEMARVVKPGGKPVMIDMEAADEPLRKTEDEIETLRDPSHVKNLSKAEMLSLFATYGLAVEKSETTEMPQRLENWLALTQTPAAIREKIRQRRIPPFLVIQPSGCIG